MRVTTVRSARKKQRPCERCGAEINPGTGYKSISPRYGAKRVRCLPCPYWRPSETTSSKMATAYAGQEAAHDALDAMDWDSYEGTPTERVEAFTEDLKTIAGDCAQSGRDTAEEYQEGLDAMPDGLRDAAYDTQEKIDSLESWADDLESWEPDPAPVDEVDTSSDAEDDPDEDALTSWAEDAIESLRQAVDDLPC